MNGSFEAREMALRLLAARQSGDRKIFRDEVEKTPVDHKFLSALITELVSFTDLALALAAEALDVDELSLARSIEKARDEDEARWRRENEATEGES